MLKDPRIPGLVMTDLLHTALSLCEKLSPDEYVGFNELFFGPADRYKAYCMDFYRFAQDAMPEEMVQCIIGAYWIGWVMHEIYNEKAAEHTKKQQEKISP